MKPHVLIVIDGADDDDLSAVRLSMSGVTDDGVEHYVRIYEDVQRIQPLPDTMVAEQWVLTTVANVSDYIRAALIESINQGKRTLMLDTYVVKRD